MRPNTTKIRNRKFFHAVFLCIVLSAAALPCFAGDVYSIPPQAEKLYLDGIAAAMVASPSKPREIQAAIDDLKQVIALAPSSPTGYAMLAWAQEKAQDYPGAIQNLQNVIRLTPRAEAVINDKKMIVELKAKAEQARLAAAEAERETKQEKLQQTFGAYLGNWTESLTYSYNAFLIGPHTVTAAGTFSFVKKDDHTIEGYQENLNVTGSWAMQRKTERLLLLRGTISENNPSEIKWVVFPLKVKIFYQRLPGKKPENCPNLESEGFPITLSPNESFSAISFQYAFKDFQKCYPHDTLGADAAAWTLNR